MSALAGVNNALNTALRFNQMREQNEYRDTLKQKAQLDITTATANQSYQMLSAANLIDTVGNLNEPAVRRVLAGDGSAQEKMALGSLFNNLNPEQTQNMQVGLSYDPKTKMVSAPTLTTDPQTGEQTPGAITVDGSSEPNSEVARLSVGDAFSNLKGLYATSVLSKQDLLDVDDMRRNNTLYRPEIALTQSKLIDDLAFNPEVQRGVLGELARLERDEDKLEFAVAFNLDYLDKDPQGVVLGLADSYDETALKKVYDMVQAEGIQDPRQVAKLPINKQIQVFAASVASMPDGEAKNKAARKYGDLIQAGLLSNQDTPDANKMADLAKEDRQTGSEMLKDMGKTTQALTTAILNNEKNIEETIRFNAQQKEKEGFLYDDDDIQPEKSFVTAVRDPEILKPMQQMLTELELANQSGKPGVIKKARTNLQDGVARLIGTIGNQVTNESLSAIPFGLGDGVDVALTNWWNNRTKAQQTIATMGGRLRLSEDGNSYGIASVAGNSDINKNPVPATVVAAILGPELEQVLRASLENNDSTRF